MAWHYKKYQREQSSADRVIYSDAEREARRQKIGLWQDPHPVPPWDYMQAEREHRKSVEPFCRQVDGVVIESRNLGARVQL